jgi:signal transduction histidine kinase
MASLTRCWEDYGPQLPEEARKYLRTIRGGAQRMGCLIDDLLAFSRLNRQALTKQPVDMEYLVRGVLEDVIPEGHKKNIQIVNGNLPIAHGDPSLLRQVWVNLLSNAIKYSRMLSRPESRSAL